MTLASRRLRLVTCALALLVAWRRADILRAAIPPETIRREFPVSGRPRLTIQNGRGDIVVAAWPRRTIELKAVRTGSDAADLASVAVDIAATADQVAIESRTPAGVPLPRTRIDYELHVPADTDLRSIETARGRVEIRGIAGRAIVRVENGPVRIADFAGTLDATTINGDIEASLARLAPEESLKLETFNGDIRLQIPKTAAPHFQVRTLNGKITSQLPLDVQNLYGPDVAHAPGAPDAPFIELVSVTGDIRILRR